MVIQNTTFTHIPQFDSFPLISQQEVHALDVAMNDSTRVQMQQTYTYLPSVRPQIFLRKVKAFLYLILDKLGFIKMENSR